SESAEFARACSETDLVFVGPPPESIARMKDKNQARKLASAAGVPVMPNTRDVVPDVPTTLAETSQIGYPMLCKTTSNKNSIDMATTKNPTKLEKIFHQYTDQTKTTFNRKNLYLKQYFPTPRHLEVQILNNHHSHTLHYLERECSI